jgi:2,4-dienoyl-CoA reductase-like NADH-dependent reductase (Old Yellow Enzyme family)
MEQPPYLAPGYIGKVALRNRLIRAATSETMCTTDGEVTDELIALYSNLAKGGAGLLITGHIYIEPRGQCSDRQIGIYSDRLIPGLRRLTDAVHKFGGKIFAELSHAGSQSGMPGIEPVAPSETRNDIFGTRARELTTNEIDGIIWAFDAAAHRAVAAGFDGIHIHAGNGYLIAQFSSPYTNRRIDKWGIGPQGRDRFFVAVYSAIRDAVGNDFPISARFGVADSIAGGLDEQEGIARAVLLRKLGIDAIEVSYGVMETYLSNIRPYVALSFRHAVSDWVLPWLWRKPAPEAYYRAFAVAIKKVSDVPIILVGGIRSTKTMADVLASGHADFLSLARPFVREPNLPLKLMAGHEGVVDCVSCNICLEHDGYDALKCWRKDARDLFHHAIWKLQQMHSHG